MLRGQSNRMGCHYKASSVNHYSRVPRYSLQVVQREAQTFFNLLGFAYGNFVRSLLATGEAYSLTSTTTVG